ncbi:MAG: hypothetical protein J6T74_01110 [Clostridia bacterium]|nr:hypothetical protein [Clostridia bacterium]
MKLRLWAEALLILIAIMFFAMIFSETLVLSFIGIIGLMITCIPLARFGRLNDIEKR